MKQKIVIQVSMNGCKKICCGVPMTGISFRRLNLRSTALKIAVGFPGIESAALEGRDKDQIVLTGDGIDAVVLTNMLRRKVGHAELVSITLLETKKEEPKVQPMAWSYGHGVPQYQNYETGAPNPCNCSI